MNDTIVPKSLAEAKTMLENKMVEVLAILEAKTGKAMPILPIHFKPLGLRLGVAQRHPFEGDSIIINSDTVNEKYWEETLNTTLPHEVCHHVAPIIYDRWRHGHDRNQGWGHGEAWKHCMRMVGLVPNRCSVVSRNDARQDLALRVVPRNYGYTCNCQGKIHFVTKTIHNRVLQGRGRRCIRCKTSLKFAGEKS